MGDIIIRNDLYFHGRRASAAPILEAAGVLNAFGVERGGIVALDVGLKLLGTWVLPPRRGMPVSNVDGGVSRKGVRRLGPLFGPHR